MPCFGYPHRWAQVGLVLLYWAGLAREMAQQFGWSRMREDLSGFCHRFFEASRWLEIEAGS